MNTGGISFANTISPVREIVSYEALWTKYTTFKQLADAFREASHILPSVLAQKVGISEELTGPIKHKLEKFLPFTDYTALFYQDFEYPHSLRDAKYPVEVLYYQGILDLLHTKIVSVVGARKASPEGLRRARKVARLLVKNNITVMSGLAEGIDTAAHEAALEAGGRTIGVIGTPLNEYYPRSNRELQQKISETHLLVSQVPFYFYSQRNYRSNRGFFPERNKTMSALSQATVIVEASDTSGSLIQAKAALSQGRKLFILNSCFEKRLQLF